MRNLLKKTLLGATLGATVLTVAAPAEAQYRRYHRDRDHTGAAVVAGVAGLAIGAALASGRRDRYYDRGGYGYYNRGYGYYDRGYYPRRAYNRGYYNRGYYDRGYGYRCRTRWTYDPYVGRRVRVRYC